LSESHFDAVVIGAGPGGRNAARPLAKEGMKVAIVERELVGGECPFWACIPSKTLLRPPEVKSEAEESAGVEEPSLDWEETRRYRDYMVSDWDDSEKAKSLEKAGIEVVRGDARLAGRGRVEVGERVLATERIVIATGSTTAVPPIDGLDGVEYWTNREATALKGVPASVAVVGGGPVAVELGQMLRRFGSEVTLIESADRVLSREDAHVGEAVAAALEAEGIRLLLGSEVKSVARADGGVRVVVDGGDELEAERLVLAAGRKPRLDGLEVDAVGIEPGKKGIEIDDRCRAEEGVWATGDVTGVAQFTHVASYQAQIAAGDMLGRDVRTDYRAVPRVVFCDPEVAAVGLTQEQAEGEGVKLATATVDLSNADRTETFGRGLEGHLTLLADRERGTLVGAAAVGPLAGEWIHMLVLAVKAEIPVAILRDTMFQFPTFAELVKMAARRLEV
jgi:pyruvate/2-oxoglutarate dehydrogenase complex dihydrolipoamide dehydrogenase (E3) component